MIHARQAPIGLSIAALTLAAAAMGVPSPAGVEAHGLRNCVDVTGPNTGRVGCYEHVWVDGTEVRMTFSNQGFSGATPTELDPFYVVAAQSGTAQGPMATFPHDHVIDAGPARNHGTYSTRLQGHFVVCTGQGLVSGACDAVWMTPPGGIQLPFARTVDGQPLTSVEAIETFAAGGDLTLVDLGPGAVIVGTVTGRR